MNTLIWAHYNIPKCRTGCTYIFSEAGMNKQLKIFLAKLLVGLSHQTKLKISQKEILVGVHYMPHSQNLYDQYVRPLRLEFKQKQET